MPIGLALGASHLLMGLVLGLTVVLIPFSYHHFALANLCVQSPYCKRLSSDAAGGEETEQDDADGADDTEEQQRAEAGASGTQRAASTLQSPLLESQGTGVGTRVVIGTGD